MSSWILIIFMIAYGGSIDHVEFTGMNAEQHCIEAVAKIENETTFTNVHTVCVRN